MKLIISHSFFTLLLLLLKNAAAPLCPKTNSVDKFILFITTEGIY